jgi:hypothetical protein
VAAALAICIAGCGGSVGATPGGEPTAAVQAARLQLIRTHSKLNDLELATLCPALYPSDAISNAKKYSFDKQKVKDKPTASDLAEAAKSDCSAPSAAAAPAPAKK